MVMPMVQVGPVLMDVFLRGVLVPVRMAHRGPRFFMGVIVMSPIVSMAMLMCHRIVSVDMCMLLAEEDHEGDYHNSGSHRLRTREGLPKNGYG
jgi:hypothetical protein